MRMRRRGRMRSARQRAAHGTERGGHKRPAECQSKSRVCPQATLTCNPGGTMAKKKQASGKAKAPVRPAQSIAKFFGRQPSDDTSGSSAHGAAGSSGRPAGEPQASGAGWASARGSLPGAANQAPVLRDLDWPVDSLLESNVMLSQDNDSMKVVLMAPENFLAQEGLSSKDLRRFFRSTQQRSDGERQAAPKSRSAEDELFEELMAAPACATTGSARGNGSLVAAYGQQQELEATQPVVSAGSGPLVLQESLDNLSEQPSSSVPPATPSAGPVAGTPKPTQGFGPSQALVDAKTPATAQASAGKRRKYLMELLDQVETLVSQTQSSPSPGVSGRPPVSASRLKGSGVPFSTTTTTSGVKRRVGTPGSAKGLPPTPSTSGRAGRASGFASPTPVRSKGRTASLELRQRQSASMGRLCDELLGDSPTQRVGPTVLFGNRELGEEQQENKQGPKPKSAAEEDVASKPPSDVLGSNAIPAAASGLAGDKRLEEMQPSLVLAGSREAVNYTVLEVHIEGHKKILRLLNEYTDREVEAHLLDGWADTPANPGDSLNLLAEVETHCGQDYSRVDSDSGLVVLHPDILLSGTRITAATKCLRQAAIEEIYGGDGASNTAAVRGTMLHELFQVALQDPTKGPLEMQVAVDSILASSTLSLYEVGLEEPTARQMLAEMIPGILQWRERFCKEAPGPGCPDIDMGPKGPGDDGMDSQRVAVAEVMDIEESIWSPRFGLKGIVDASVRVYMEDASPGPSAYSSASAERRDHPQPDSPRIFRGRAPPRRSDIGRVQSIAPLELKTGKPFHGHRAQVALYMLLLAERYKVDISTGLLWYTTQELPQGVQYLHVEVAALIQLRNSLAAHLARSTGPGQVHSLPPMLRDPQGCKRCFQAETCMVLHKATENGTGDSAGAGTLLEEAAGHIKPQHSSFIQRWLALVEAESSAPVDSRASVWALTSEQREAKGEACMGRLRLVSWPGEGGAGGVKPSISSGYPEDRTYAFHRAWSSAQESQQLAPPFNDGDRVILSIEGEHVALARGYVASTGPGSITVATFEPLQRRFSPVQAESDSGGTPWGALWRVDGDSAYSSAMALRRNLIRLLSGKSPRPTRLRELLVDQEPPRVAAAPPEAAQCYVDIQEDGVNEDQSQAIRKVLLARDYAVILGMPGTGKTSTICHTVQALVASGLSVLLTAYTNSAVDNMLLRLKGMGMDKFLRVGSRGSVHPGLQDNCLGGSRFPTKSVGELRHLANEVLVVGTTCLGVGHTLVQSRQFDVVVVDEASQITFPASLGAMSMASRFVLVGDHYQLPPLVQDSTAAADGLSTSLFETLTGAHPSACAVLSRQYRMCRPIMDLANLLVYSGAMTCGCSLVADARLKLAAGWEKSTSPTGWLTKVIDPDSPLVFLDTGDQMPEERSGSSSCNPGEVRVVVSCLEALQAADLDMMSAAVISPYRGQITALKRDVNKTFGESTGLEVLTVDKSQGRDKACVIMSLVKSNSQRSPGDLLADWRRVNVAITRAKHKLILVGSRQTLEVVPFFEALLAKAEADGWIIPLPPGYCQSAVVTAGAQ